MPSKGLDVFASTFLSKATRKADLIGKLKDLHAELMNTSQDPEERPRGLGQTSAHLISQRLLGHGDKEVRLLSACCIVDVLRVYAPEAPYDDGELCRVFDVINTQLRGLATHDTSSGIGSKIFYILQSLSVVKSCVVLVVLSQSGVEGADELLRQLFEALISSIRPEHTDDVGNHMVTVLQACIEESEGRVEQEMLDVLLQPLLPASKAENPAAYKLCQAVLRRTTAALQAPISTFVNHVLVGTSSNAVDGSELSDQIYPLIFELHKISPGLLLKVLPNICVQLQAEEEDVRLKAVKLLGRLFASQHAEYGTEFARNFKDLLGRFKDVSPAVRLEMVENCSLIMKRKPSLRQNVEDLLVLRLRDPERDVRHSALMRLVEVAQEEPLVLSAASYAEMGERLKDRKADIRKAAMVGLAKIYSRNVAVLFPRVDHEAVRRSGGDAAQYMPTALWTRLSFVPAAIVNSWGYPDLANRHVVLQLLQEYILPKRLANEDDGDDGGASSGKRDRAEQQSGDTKASPRATALLAAFSSMTETERELLGAILAYKSKVRSAVVTFLDARTAAAKTGNPGDDISVKRAMHALNKVLPWKDVGGDRKTQLLSRLLECKDKNVFRLLHVTVDSASGSGGSERDGGIDACVARREQLKQRVDSKSALGNYCGLLTDFTGPLLINARMLQELLSLAAMTTSQVPALLRSVAKNSAFLFGGTSLLLLRWASTSVAPAAGKRSGAPTGSAARAATALDIMKSVALHVAQDDGADKLCKFLLQQAQTHTDPGVCEVASETAAHLIRAGCKGSGSQAFEDLAAAKSLHLQNPRLVHCLSALVGLMGPSAGVATTEGDKGGKRDGSTTMFASEAARRRLRLFITDELLAGQDAAKEQDDDGEDIPGARGGRLGFANAAGVSLRLWASLLDADATVSRPMDMPPKVRALLDACLDCLAAEGATLGAVHFQRSQDQRIVRVAAVSACFALLRLPCVSKGMDALEWQTLGWALLDAGIDARRSMLSALSRLIQMHSVHPRILAYPLLFGDDEQLAPIAERALLFAIKRKRLTHEALCARAMEDPSDRARQLAEQSMPEGVLPYALHLLSHHPDFPTSTTVDGEGDTVRMEHLIRSVKMVVKVLLGSLRQGADNLSFLLKQVDMISQNYEDALDADNLGLSFVTRLTQKVLKRRIRTAENVQPYAGDVLLPSDLFTARPERDGGDGRYGALDGLDEEADDAIDRALANAGRAPRKASAPRQGEEAAAAAGERRKRRSAKRAKRASESAAGDEEEDEEEEEDSDVDVDAEMEAAPRVPRQQQTRSGRRVTVASYVDRGESEKEALRWEKALEEKQLEAQKQRKLTAFFKPVASSGSTSAADDGDDAASEKEVGDSSDQKEEDEDEDEEEVRARPSLQSIDVNIVASAGRKSRATTGGSSKSVGKATAAASKGKSKSKGRGNGKAQAGRVKAR